MHGILHTILAGATVGIFFLGAVAFLMRFVLRDGETLTARRADTVLFVSVAAGTVFGSLALLTGLFSTWPLAAITGTVLAQNKLLTAVTAVAAFAMLWLLRSRAGRGMWKDARLRLWAAVLMLIAMLNIGLTGSMGGSAALKGTALDPLLLALELNRYVSLSWGPLLNVLVLLLSAAAVVYSLRRKAVASRAEAPGQGE
jgi:hypothetical protein